MMPTLSLAREAIENRDYRRHVNQVEAATGAFAHSREISRLLTAAVVSRTFCSLLLADPAQAIANGYNGEAFKLTPEEVQQLRTIQASSLRDFAAQLLNKGRSSEKAVVEPQPSLWRNKVYATA